MVPAHAVKWNESGFRPPLCTYRLNWARRTSWGWWDDWDDTVLQTQDSKFEPWRSEAEHATSRSRRLPTILTFTRGWGRNNFVSFKPPRPGTEPRTLAWKAAVLTTTLGPPPGSCCGNVEMKQGEYERESWACANEYVEHSHSITALSHHKGTDNGTKFVYCWPTDVDAGPTPTQHWVNGSFPRSYICSIKKQVCILVRLTI